MTHKGVIFSPVIAFLMRLWLWLSTTIITEEWVACHRKHHAFPDQEQDPHSPVKQGFLRVTLAGVFLYIKAVRDKEMVKRYGKGCPDDWLERNIFSHRYVGICILPVIDFLLQRWFFPDFFILTFAAVWLSQGIGMIVLGQIVNGPGHTFGYRNTDVDDHSTNIIPIGIIIVGEELHNNHHANPASPKFSRKWYEFDLGWVYIKLLSLIGLAKVRYSTTK